MSRKFGMKAALQTGLHSATFLMHFGRELGVTVNNCVDLGPFFFFFFVFEALENGRFDCHIHFKLYLQDYIFFTPLNSKKKKKSSCS